MRSVKLVLFFACKLIGLFHLARWMTRDRLKILCYHGFALANEAEFRPKLFIKPEKFEQRLATIQRHGFNVLPLGEAVERLYSRTLPGDALVITIDDGFHSVHRLAVPRLQRYGFPATVYVTTYYVEHPNPIFRLVVQYMFWKTRKRELVLKNVCWTPDEVVDLSDVALREQITWRCIDFGESNATENARHALCEQLGELLETPYEEIVQEKIFHLMSSNELLALCDTKIGIELHTHRHTFPSDDQSVAQREIADNLSAIKRLINIEAHHFCYPSGLWDERQWPWLDGMHVKSSTTCLPGLNSHMTPRHALRRFLDGEDIHQLEFEAALTGFSDLARALRQKLS